MEVDYSASFCATIKIAWPIRVAAGQSEIAINFSSVINNSYIVNVTTNNSCVNFTCN